jgi:GNAT superfamily N-acetyltransferase
MDLALRPPRPGDGPGLARCWLDAGASYAALNPALFQVPSADGLAQSLEDRFLHLVATDALVLVADRAGQVVGYLIATIAQPSPRAAMDASRDAGLVRLVIDALIIREDSRHQGIGTQLMEAAERWGRGRGAAIVVLETYVDSPLSVPFYEQHLGYRRRCAC